MASKLDKEAGVRELEQHEHALDLFLDKARSKTCWEHQAIPRLSMVAALGSKGQCRTPSSDLWPARDQR